MRSDRRHLHHLLIDAGFGPRVTVLVMAGLSLACIGLSALMHLAAVADVVTGLCVVSLTALYVGRRRHIVRAFGRLAPQAVVGPAE